MSPSSGIWSWCCIISPPRACPCNVKVLAAFFLKLQSLGISLHFQHLVGISEILRSSYSAIRPWCPSDVVSENCFIWMLAQFRRIKCWHNFNGNVECWHGFMNIGTTSAKIKCWRGFMALAKMECWHDFMASAQMECWHDFMASAQMECWRSFMALAQMKCCRGFMAKMNVGTASAKMECWHDFMASAQIKCWRSFMAWMNVDTTSVQMMVWLQYKCRHEWNVDVAPWQSWMLAQLQYKDRY